MAENVKFFRLGLIRPVKYDAYRSVCDANDGAIVFACVLGGNGSWKDNELVPPTHYIWANGIEYKVADADALNYLFEQFNKLVGEGWDGSDITTIINNIVDPQIADLSTRIAEIAEGSTEKIEELEEKVAEIDASILDLKEADKELEEALEDFKDEMDSSLAEIREDIEDIREDLQEFIDSSLVKTIKTESLSDYLVLEPTDPEDGEVTIKGELKIVDVADASEGATGLADALDVKNYVLNAIAEIDHLKYKVVDVLPAIEDADKSTIYLVKKEGSKTAEGDVYQEWMAIEGHWELLGDTTLNLDNYYTKEETDELLADLSTNIKDYVDEKDEELKDALAEFMADTSAALEQINETNAAQEEHLEALDASVDRLDASVSALEEKVLTGVVNSLTSDSLEETGYVRLTKNEAATGDVEVILDADVQDHCDVELLDSANPEKGLATTQYVEDRFSWIVIEDSVTPEESKQADGTYYSEESIEVADSELETLTADGKSIEITSEKEITIG